MVWPLPTDGRVCLASASIALVFLAMPLRAGQANDAAVRQAIVAAEAARSTDAAAIAPLLAGIKSDQPVTQQLAVRGLGRLERASLVPSIAPLCDAASPIVRAEAANALAQALQSQGELDTSAVATTLRARLAKEGDATVRGVLYEAIGRLPYRTPEEVRSAEATVVDGLAEAPRDKTLATPLGAARGFEALFRVQAKRGTPVPAAIDRLREAAVLAPPRATGTARENAARIRRLAITALQSVNATDLATLRAGLKDPDELVRKQAASFLEGHGRPNYSDAKAQELAPIVREALDRRDRSPLVRYEVVQAYGRYLREQSCAPLLASAVDPATLVAQAAIDALGRGCPASEAATVADGLVRIARTLPADDKPSATRRVEWHRAAHAIVSLATAAPDRAKTLLPTFAAHPVWQVRAYAARAAAAMNDADTLRTLAKDPSTNVASAAVTGLGRVTAHADDAIFIASLGRRDHQIIQLSARALAGSPNKADAMPALLATLRDLTAEKKDNTRDARVAILQRVQELGAADRASDLTPLVTDFDPRVAALAADTLTKWTGTPHKAAPNRPPTAVPTFAEMQKLESTVVRVRMRAAGTFELRLYPFETPATVDRFVRLARAGYYDGLTFHRIAPNWVIQGGSPAATEVTGDSPFMIDEVGLRSHTRGTLGMSTRGHDTGDAQFFVNLGDNPSLDHGFGVWAEVTKGMDVVDAVVEGDVIEKIELAPSGAKQSQ